MAESTILTTIITVTMTMTVIATVTVTVTVTFTVHRSCYVYYHTHTVATTRRGVISSYHWIARARTVTAAHAACTMRS